jgi:hypothetical protein
MITRVAIVAGAGAGAGAVAGGGGGLGRATALALHAAGLTGPAPSRRGPSPTSSFSSLAMPRRRPAEPFYRRTVDEAGRRVAPSSDSIEN